MANNYDPIARYYDFLHRLVFGQTEIEAQVEMLGYIKPGSRVLIVGGGTGWILEKLSALSLKALRITYVEPSAGMMALSRSRDYGEMAVDFVQLPIEDFVTEERYDCIFTAFFFDNFPAGPIGSMIRALDRLLQIGGYWLEADFYYPAERRKWWQRALLQTMYRSARRVCGVEAKALVDVEPILAGAGYRVVFRGFHYRKFIRSIVCQKE